MAKNPTDWLSARIGVSFGDALAPIRADITPFIARRREF